MKTTMIAYGLRASAENNLPGYQPPQLTSLKQFWKSLQQQQVFIVHNVRN